jgi:hypothetical protein
MLEITVTALQTGSGEQRWVDEKIFQKKAPIFLSGAQY